MGTILGTKITKDNKIIFEVEMAGEVLLFKTPILFQWTDPVVGEQYRNLEIHPPITVSVAQELCLFPSIDSKEINVVITNNQDNFQGNLFVRTPENWAIDREKIPLAMGKAGEELSETMPLLMWFKKSESK